MRSLRIAAFAVACAGAVVVAGSSQVHASPRCQHIDAQHFEVDQRGA